VQSVLEAGASRDSLSYEILRTLADLDSAVVEVIGHTRYRIEGDPVRDDATISVVDRAGIGAEIQSRVDSDPALRGTKHRVATDRHVLVTRGRSDDRLVMIIPEVKDTAAVGLTLLHVRLHEQVSAAVARGVLTGYQNRYSALKDAVLETEPVFRDDDLANMSLADLLVRPIPQLADTLRRS